MMTLEQALNGASMQAICRHVGGGTTIVDAVATNRNPHYPNEETYWVQRPYKIVREAYHSLEEVKAVVAYADSDDWQPYGE